jgi:hypothetical protein
MYQEEEEGKKYPNFRSTPRKDADVVSNGYDGREDDNGSRAPFGDGKGGCGNNSHLP